MPEEKRVSPAMVIIPVLGLGLGLGLVAVLAAAAWAAPPAAKFKVSDLVISPVEVNPGSPVTISCLVTNIGAEAGEYTVTLGGDFVAEQTVSLEPGESKVISFEVTPVVAKSYSVSVDGLYGGFLVTEMPVADIRLSDLVISPTVVYVGETVLTSVVATNYGTVAGSRKIIHTVT